jgi:hypothetical protein
VITLKSPDNYAAIAVKLFNTSLKNNEPKKGNFNCISSGCREALLGNIFEHINPNALIIRM